MSTVGKLHADATLDAAAVDSQTIFYAVEISFSTTLRLNDSGGKLIVDGDTYYPWTFSIGNIGTSQNLSESVTLSFFSGDMTEATENTQTGTLTDIEAAGDSTGTTITIYRVINELDGTQSEETYFLGTIDSVQCSETQWRITCLTAESLGTLLPANMDIGLCRWRRYGNTDCGITPDFTGTGVDDMSVESFGEQTAAAFYEIQIEVAGGDPTSPNTYRWRVNSGAWDTGNACSTSAVELSNGFEISFGATTGHDDSDLWQIDAFCTFTYEDCAGTAAGSNKDNDLRYGGLPHSPLPGEKILIPGAFGTVGHGPYAPRGYFHRRAEEEEIHYPVDFDVQYPVDDPANSPEETTETEQQPAPRRVGRR